MPTNQPSAEPSHSRESLAHRLGSILPMLGTSLLGRTSLLLFQHGKPMSAEQRKIYGGLTKEIVDSDFRIKRIPDVPWYKKLLPSGSLSYGYMGRYTKPVAATNSGPKSTLFFGWGTPEELAVQRAAHDKKIADALAKTRFYKGEVGLPNRPDIGVVAHELGHIKQSPAMQRLAAGKFRTIPMFAGALPLLTNNEDHGAALAAVGSLTSAPLLTGEIDASLRGAKILRQKGMRLGLGAFKGVPSYLAIAAAPWALHAGKKMFNQYDTPLPMPTSNTEQTKVAFVLLQIGEKLNLDKAASTLPGAPSVALKSPESIMRDMQASGLVQGLAGAGIGAAGGALVGSMSGDDEQLSDDQNNRKRRNRRLLGMIFGGLAGGGVGAYRGADSALRAGFGENADILDDTANKHQIPLTGVEFPQAADTRRIARELRGTTLLKVLLGVQ